jgi:hypothetical protein
MSDIEDLLARIDAEKRAFDQTIRPPASPAAIERLRAHACDALRTELPAGYIALLGRNDGLDFNGYAIYGATEQADPFLSGFAEANARLSNPPAKYVFYGDTGDALYAQDRATCAWVALDRPSLDVIETFPRFDAMLVRVLCDAFET